MQDIPGLAEARGRLIAAATTGDAEALAGVYTSDAVLMNPDDAASPAGIIRK